MTIKLYRAINIGDARIEECEATKETPNFYIINGRRQGKIGDWEMFAASYDEAKQWLIDTTTKEIAGLQKQLEYQQRKLEKIKQL